MATLDARINIDYCVAINVHHIRNYSSKSEDYNRILE